MGSNDFFNDMMQALGEAERHIKGNIQLKSTVMSVPDEDLSDEARLYYQFARLSEGGKDKALKFVGDLLDYELRQAAV